LCSTENAYRVAPRPSVSGNGIRQFWNLKLGEVCEKPLRDDPAICVDMERLLRLASCAQNGKFAFNHAAERRPMERVPTVSGTTNLVDILDRVLDKGLVIAGDVRVSLANVELLTIRIRLLVCSVDKAEQIGLNWWKYDPHLTIQAPVVPALAAKAPPSSRRAPGPKATRVRRPR